ncbi:MAG: hypothetical protein R2932_26310 [Caldilineaceae bacterium]
MFAFSMASGLPSGSRTVWSRLSLQPLAAGPLTPFSYSVLEEVLRRAWYQYFDELGFEPMPRARVVRQQNGYPYLNLTISAQRDAEHGAIEPLTLLLNGDRFPITTWEKPGLFAALKVGRNRKKVEALLTRYETDLPRILQKAEAWSTKTKELRWTQADVLQVMEEIERISVDSLKLFFAARHHLELTCNRLLWLTEDRAPYPANVALIGNSLCDLTGLHEYTIAADLIALGTLASADPAVMAWLAAGNYEDWPARLPNQEFVEATQKFMANYGHRGVSEAEIRNRRWQDDPRILFTAIHTVVEKQAHTPARLPTAQPLQQLLGAVEGAAQKPAQQLVAQLRRLLLLQSNALNAFAHVLGGTHRWALAAAGEAMADGRLTQRDDVFFFALEEMKQMMTGEWNISSTHEIQATNQKRRAEFTQWQAARVPPLLIGDAAAESVTIGLPGVSGQATGPLRRWMSPVPERCNGAIVGAQQFTSGWSLILPFTRSLIAADGTPLDPFVAAARAWHVPTVVGLGDVFDELVEGAQTTVQGDRGLVEQ